MPQEPHRLTPSKADRARPRPEMLLRGVVAILRNARQGQPSQPLSKNSSVFGHPPRCRSDQPVGAACCANGKKNAWFPMPGAPAPAPRARMKLCEGDGVGIPPDSRFFMSDLRFMRAGAVIRSAFAMASKRNVPGQIMAPIGYR